MNFKKWNIAACDKALAKQLSEECDIDPITAYIASGRGYTDPYELEQLLSDEAFLYDLHELNDIYVAAQIVNAAIENDSLIAIYGDYDCDGVVATAIVYDYLSSRNARCIYYVPDRFSEGYGMNKNALDYLNGKGVNLIITVDNGISSIDEISYAKELGMKVIVTDHHIPKDILPEADAVVDPHKADSQSSFKDICGAFVAFKLICAVNSSEPEEMLERYSDYLAVATIGDVMPLIYENRSVVKAGLNKLISNPCVGLSAILNVAGVDRADISSSKVAFGIVPRINAAGRMGSASRAVELLLCDNMLDALKIANELDSENSRRQQIEKTIFSEACVKIEENGYQYNRVIVVEGENWHSGIVGISASRLVEKYGKPVIVLSVDESYACGSGRSCGKFSLFEAINHCSDLLDKFGGHELAAGVSMKKDLIPDFRKKINKFACSLPVAYPEINIDCKLRPSALTVDLALALKELEPFGNGNPVPSLGIFSVKLQKITPIGSGKHLRLLFEKDGIPFQALLFGVTPESFSFECGDTVDIAVNLDVNLYKDNLNLSIIIKAIRISGIDNDPVIYENQNYHDFKSGEAFDYTVILPTREEVGSVYRYIISSPSNQNKIINRFLNSLGCAKTMISLDTLTELRLIEYKDNIYIAQTGVKKTDLKNSHTYNSLLKEGEI